MRNLLLLFTCLLLSACSQSQKGLQQTVKLALFGPDDVQISDQHIASLPYASMYLRINHGQRIFVVLGFNENGQQKWLTRDKAMVVTQRGRIIKTLGLATNLYQVNSLQQDPLVDSRRLVSGAAWSRLVSWTRHGQFHASMVISRFTRGADQALVLAGERVVCQVWHENVTLRANNRAWVNTFWIDPRSGEVRQSQQRIDGGDFTLETTILKPAIS